MIKKGPKTLIREGEKSLISEAVIYYGKELFFVFSVLRSLKWPEKFLNAVETLMLIL